MSEYIVDVPDEEAELFIARFGIEGTTMFGHRLTDEIVRCSDCERWESGDCDWNPYHGDPVDDQPEGYCAWGVRKEVDE